MIVKNEQDWIEGALESVRSLADEIILGDTGCTDQTIPRARQFSPQIIDIKWTEDFAAARNRTLAEARQPWILVLDADERIAARDLRAIESAIRGPEHGFHLVQRNYVLGNQVFGWTANTGEYEEGRQYTGYVDNPLIRFFRNDPALRFQGAVHEIIDPTRLSTDFRFGSIPVVLHHYGKVREAERVAAKQQHYLDLGLKKVQEDPTSAKAVFDLGIQYQELRRHKEAVECFTRAFAMNGRPAALLFAAISEKSQNRYTEALDLLDRAAANGLDTFDIHLERGNVLLGLGRVSDALKAYSASERMKPDNPIAAFNCGLALRKLGAAAGAEGYYRKALKLDPAFDKAALELAILQSESGRNDEAAARIEAVVARSPGYREARLTLAKTYIALNRSSDALKVLESASPDDAVARCLAGAAHLQQGDLDRAEAQLEAALRKDRSLVDARINLARIYAHRGDAAKAERYRLAAAAAVRPETKVRPSL